MFEGVEAEDSDGEGYRTRILIGLGLFACLVVLVFGTIVMPQQEAEERAQEQKREAENREREASAALVAEREERERERETQMFSHPDVYGEQTLFEDFFVKVRTTGVPGSKRFRFTATPSSAEEITELCKSGQPGTSSCLPAVADFDDAEQMKSLLASLVRKYDASCTVVVSVPGDERVHINRVDGCS